MLVKTTQYKSSGISSANLLRALEIFDLPPAISPELNKCPGSNQGRYQTSFFGGGGVRVNFTDKPHVFADN